MKIIVDTNIIIRSLINPDNRFGEILLNPKPQIQFIAPAFLREEYYKHRNKVLRFTKCSFNEFRELEFCIFDAIHFVSQKLVPEYIFEEALEFVKEIDEKDVLFVAFALWHKARLWSMDELLINGLKKKDFNLLFLQMR